MAPASSSSSSKATESLFLSHLPSIPRDILPSRIFARLDKVGQGAFGSVYKGLHTQTNHVVALKIIDLDTADDDTADIQREVGMLSAMTRNGEGAGGNNNVTRYFGCWMEGPKVWIVMDYAEGGSFRTLRKAGAIEEKYLQLMTRETLVALSHLNKVGIIHRDIKAANILLTSTPRIVLCDFGVSAPLFLSSSTSSKRTTFVGTPYWMAPEVILAKPYDTKADIWGLGITVLELADKDGEPPLSREDGMRAIMMIPKMKPPRLPDGGGWSREMREFVAGCLNELPDERLSADDLMKTKWIRSIAKAPLTPMNELLRRMDAWKDDGNKRTSVAMSIYGEDDGNELAGDDWHFNTFRPGESPHQPSASFSPPIASSSLPSSSIAPNSLRRLFEDENAPSDPFSTSVMANAADTTPISSSSRPPPSPASGSSSFLRPARINRHQPDLSTSSTGSASSLYPDDNEIDASGSRSNTIRPSAPNLATLRNGLGNSSSTSLPLDDDDSDEELRDHLVSSSSALHRSRNLSDLAFISTSDPPPPISSTSSSVPFSTSSHDRVESPTEIVDLDPPRAPFSAGRNRAGSGSSNGSGGSSGSYRDVRNSRGVADIAIVPRVKGEDGGLSTLGGAGGGGKTPSTSGLSTESAGGPAGLGIGRRNRSHSRAGDDSSHHRLPFAAPSPTARSFSSSPFTPSRSHSSRPSFDASLPNVSPSKTIHPILPSGTSSPSHHGGKSSTPLPFELPSFAINRASIVPTAATPPPPSAFSPRGLDPTSNRRPSIGARQASVAAVMETSTSPPLPSSSFPRPSIVRTATSLTPNGSSLGFPPPPSSRSRSGSMRSDLHSEFSYPSSSSASSSRNVSSPLPSLRHQTSFGGGGGPSLKDVLKLAPVPTPDGIGASDILPPSPSAREGGSRFLFHPLPSPLAYGGGGGHHSSSNMNHYDDLPPPPPIGGGRNGSFLRPSASDQSLSSTSRAFAAAAAARDRLASPSPSFGLSSPRLHSPHSHLPSSHLSSSLVPPSIRPNPSPTPSSGESISGESGVDVVGLGASIRLLDYGKLGLMSTQDVGLELERTVAELGRWLEVVEGGLEGLLELAAADEGGGSGGTSEAEDEEEEDDGDDEDLRAEGVALAT